MHKGEWGGLRGVQPNMEGKGPHSAVLCIDMWQIGAVGNMQVVRADRQGRGWAQIGRGGRGRAKREGKNQ